MLSTQGISYAKEKYYSNKVYKKAILEKTAFLL